MRRALLALSFYVGTGAFFAVNAIALLNGVSVLTAVQRGLVALVLMVLIGVLASFAVGSGRAGSRPKDIQG